MLQTLDSLQPNWQEELAHWSAAGQGSLLLKNCGSKELAELDRCLRQVCAPAQSLTLLTADLQVVAGPLTLQSWEPEKTGAFAHLYLERAESAQHLSRLAAIVAQLRSPRGCPWDRAQTPESLTPYILEEAYETVAAIRSGDPAAIAEELGDLLLQVVLQSQIFAERNHFNLETVAARIADKLIRRHPHVFGDSPQPESSDLSELHRFWEDIKQQEQPQQTLGQKLLHYAETLPPLLAALKISQKVVSSGLEWPTGERIWAKIREEEAELRQELERDPPDRARQEAELGDLLFALVALGCWYGLDAVQALTQTNLRLARRFLRLEELARQQAEQDSPLEGRSPQELEALWQQAKQEHPHPLGMAQQIEDRKN